MMVDFLSFLTVIALIRTCFERVNVFGSDWRLDGLSLRYFKQVLLKWVLFICFHCRVPIRDALLWLVIITALRLRLVPWVSPLSG